MFFTLKMRYCASVTIFFTYLRTKNVDISSVTIAKSTLTDEESKKRVTPYGKRHGKTGYAIEKHDAI